MACFKSNYVYLTYEEHDTVTANTQAVTHAAFLSMGTAWSCSNQYPWESERYPGGIETVKINICLRIYSAKWHVYAGLALLNPAAKTQVTQFAQSCTDLFKLMVAERETELMERVFAARKKVFRWENDEESNSVISRTGTKEERKPILMSDKLLDRFHMAARKATSAANSELGDLGAVAPAQTPPNSHLSLWPSSTAGRLSASILTITSTLQRRPSSGYGSAYASTSSARQSVCDSVSRCSQRSQLPRGRHRICDRFTRMGASRAVWQL